jgi:hypothetical protein
MRRLPLSLLIQLLLTHVLGICATRFVSLPTKTSDFHTCPHWLMLDVLGFLGLYVVQLLGWNLMQGGGLTRQRLMRGLESSMVFVPFHIFLDSMQFSRRPPLNGPPLGRSQMSQRL